MKYENVYKGFFIERLHRFGAMVTIDGKEEYVHVKNTGRCKELLTQGAIVYLEKSDNPERKTRYSIISTLKNGNMFNIDSQAPNTVVYEALIQGQIQKMTDLKTIKRETVYGNSRFDISFQRNNGNMGFIEIKGVTLDNDGVAMFPDAPTKRGVKHLNELMESIKQGYEAFVFFLLQYSPADVFMPNSKTDPLFAETLVSAHEAGVNIMVYDSVVKVNEIRLGKPIVLAPELHLFKEKKLHKTVKNIEKVSQNRQKCK